MNIFKKIKLWYKFDGQFYPQYLKQGIKNLYYWLPIIWKDRNYDHTYILKILKHKLKSQAEYIGSKNRHTCSLQHKRDMLICADLLDKLENDFYSSEYYDYAKDKHWFEPIPGKEGYSEWKMENIWEKYDEYFKKYPIIYRKVINDGKVKNLSDKRLIAMSIARINSDRASKLLFKIMEENIFKWWD